MHIPRSQGTPASPEMIAAVTAMVDKMGETGTARKLDVGLQTVARIVAGLPLRRGTLALIQIAMRSAEDTPVDVLHTSH